MPFPIALAGAAVVAILGAGWKYYKSNDNKNNKKEKESKSPVLIGSFAVWGRPNSGKTTFINLLCNIAVNGSPEGTTAERKFAEIPTVTVDGCCYKILSVVDMPGTEDRKNDWLRRSVEKGHAFYIVNLARKDDATYMAYVERDVRATVSAMLNVNNRKLNIIFSHVDESIWKEVEYSKVGNLVQDDPVLRRQVFEVMKCDERSVAGYNYVVNFTDKESFERLRESIVRDAYAKS